MALFGTPSRSPSKPDNQQDQRNGCNDQAAARTNGGQPNGGLEPADSCDGKKRGHHHTSRTESDRRSSRASTLTPEKLLEGLVDFPSLFGGCGGDGSFPGQLTLAALMKIGLVYSAVWMVKKIDSTLDKVPLVNVVYALLLDVLHVVVMSAFLCVKAIYNAFNYVVRAIPVRLLHHVVDSFERGVVTFLRKVDAYIAFRIKGFLWTHPRFQETFTELVDDLIHYIMKASCSTAHPDTTLSRGEQIENAFEGLNKKSFEVETN